nr:MAG TPA_asm: hypothetical protein [Caudoviricetes sp.]
MEIHKRIKQRKNENGLTIAISLCIIGTYLKPI